MDVKSSNICVQNGDVVLIDLGSVAKFDHYTVSTSVYLPQDLEHKGNNRYKSSAATDWWMLAVVYTEKVHKIEIGGQKETPTMEKIFSYCVDTPLESILKSEMEKLQTPDSA